LQYSLHYVMIMSRIGWVVFLTAPTSKTKTYGHHGNFEVI
jgi:hypothetical protein